MSSQQRRGPPYSQPKGRRSINMPWVIPPWLALVEFPGLTAKEFNKHDKKSNDVNDNSNGGNSSGSDANYKDGGNDGNKDKCEVDRNGGGNNNDSNDDIKDNNDDNGMTMMGW